MLRLLAGSAAALAVLASCSAADSQREARVPPVYAERPGVESAPHDQAFIESLIFGTAKVQKDSGVTIKRRQ